MTVAFMAPALVALMPSNSIVSSSSRRSSTPQVKAPCAPPPWRARLMVRTRLASGRALMVAISTCLFMASSRSMRGPAAVDRQRRPGDRSRGFAREEDRQRADLLDGGEALIRLLGEELVADHLFARDPMRLRLVFDLRLDEGRPDVARADRIAGDVLLGRLERRHLGEADDAVLRRHVGGLEGRGDEPMRRGDVDDAPPPGLAHRRHGKAGGVEGGGQVDGDDLVPPLNRELIDWRDVLDAGVVDEDVEPPEGLERQIDHALDRAGLRHVGRRIDRLYAVLRGDSRDDLADVVDIAEAVKHDGGAGLGERADDAEPDAAGRAGHDRDAAGELL